MSSFTTALATLGNWGGRVISWIRNPYGQMQKADAAFQQIKDLNKGSLQGDWWKQIAECDGFSRQWKNLGTQQARDREILRLANSCHDSGRYFKIPKHTYGYGKFLGSVYGLSHNFGLWMPGVALLASYLTEKKGITGLFVCDSLEALSTQIEKISQSDADQRCAFVIGTFQSGYKRQLRGFEPNFPQHKATVCVEKKDGQLTIVLLDAEPTPSENQNISSNHLTHDIWDGYEEWDQFNNQELAFRAILKACRANGCQARLLHSRVLREMDYGCTAFALQDGLAFLKDAHFFDQIVCSEEFAVKVDQEYTIEAITMLPPEYMIGTQSSRLIENFRQEGGSFDRPLLGKNKTLQQYLDDHRLEVLDDKGSSKKQNHYITKKTFKYLNLVIASLNNLSLESIQTLVNKTLVCNKPGPVLLKQASSASKACLVLHEDDDLELESYRKVEEMDLIRRLVI